MAFRADFKVDLRFRRAGLKSFATGAFHDRVDIVRMDIRFHQASKFAAAFLDISRWRAHASRALAFAPLT